MHVIQHQFTKIFLGWALAYTCYLVNRLHSSAIRGKTPSEVWSEIVAQDYDSLHVFGYPAYYHIKEDKFG